MKIDRTLTDILDFEQFLALCFSTSLEIKIARAIVNEIQSKGYAFLLRLKAKLVRSTTNPAGICSAGSLSATWKRLLNSGMLTRKTRHEPAKLSNQFSNRAIAVATYWQKWIERPR